MFPSNCKISYPTKFNIKKSKPKKIKNYFWTGGNINPVYTSEEEPESKPLKVIRLSTMIKNLVDPRVDTEPYYGEDVKGSHNQVNQILADKLASLNDKNEKIKLYLAEIERLKAEQDDANKNNNNSVGLTPTDNPTLTPEPKGEPK